VLTPRLRRLSLAAACLSLGLISATAPSAQAQGVTPSKATPQVRYAAPQTVYAVPLVPQAAPQLYATGQFASPQAYGPCACYYPQGYCPFPSGNCVFPRGNCVAIRPSGQWPVGSSQLGSSQAASAFTPNMIGD
jgi:hypothetical protein